jgi:hypothetical protein
VLFGLGICFLVAASVLWVVVWVPPTGQAETHPANGGADAGAGSLAKMASTAQMAGQAAR